MHLQEAQDILRGAEHALDSGQSLTLEQWKERQSQLYKAREVIHRNGYTLNHCDAFLERVKAEIESQQGQRRHNQNIIVAIALAIVGLIATIVFGVLPYLVRTPAAMQPHPSPTVAPTTVQTPTSALPLSTPRLSISPVTAPTTTPQSQETTQTATP